MPKCSQYIIWGSSGHAKVVADLITLRGGTVVALFDNDPRANPCLPDIPLAFGIPGFLNWVQQQVAMNGVCGAIAIGGAKGADRQKLLQDIRAAGISMFPLIHPAASVSKTAHFGDGCQVLANAVVAADVVMGTVCIINNSANVDHECQLADGVHIAPGAILCGCVTVGENAMVGAGAVVLPRIHIGREAQVGAGAVVTRNVPDLVVVTGNPAKILRRKS